MVERCFSSVLMIPYSLLKFDLILEIISLLICICFYFFYIYIFNWKIISMSVEGLIKFTSCFCWTHSVLYKCCWGNLYDSYFSAEQLTEISEFAPACYVSEVILHCHSHSVRSRANTAPTDGGGQPSSQISPVETTEGKKLRRKWLLFLVKHPCWLKWNVGHRSAGGH